MTYMFILKCALKLVLKKYPTNTEFVRTYALNSLTHYILLRMSLQILTFYVLRTKAYIINYFNYANGSKIWKDAKIFYPSLQIKSSREHFLPF